MTGPIPSAAAAPTAPPPSPTGGVVGGALGKNEFLKLLVAQMKHQDPLNPMDGQQMATQLAQFTSVEQLMNIGDKLDMQSAENAALINAVNSSSAMNLLGRTVDVQTDVLEVGPNGPTTGSVEVPSAGGNLTLRITDSAGHTISTTPLGFREGGYTDIDLSKAIEDLEPGTYRIAVDCDQGNGAVSLTPRLALHVDGVRFGADQAYITSGSSTFPISLIAAVRVPAAPAAPDENTGSSNSPSGG